MVTKTVICVIIPTRGLDWVVLEEKYDFRVGTLKYCERGKIIQKFMSQADDHRRGFFDFGTK